MKNFEKLRQLLTEADSIIQKDLSKMGYEEAIQLLAKLSSAAFGVDTIKTDEELAYLSIIAQQLKENPKASHARAEATSKGTIHYAITKNATDLKQLATRSQSIIRVHLQSLLKTDLGMIDSLSQT